MTTEGETTMKITKKSMLTGVTRTIDMPITDQQYDDWVDGTPIQNVMPHLTAGQREFLITGIPDEEWAEHMGVEE